MFTSCKRFGFLVLAVAGMGFWTTTAVWGQGPGNLNPYFRLSPGMTQQQYMQNLRATAGAYAATPPWMFGLNQQNPGQTYPTPINNTMLPNPYTPYIPNPYDPYYNPYAAFYGNYLMGVGEVMRASGQLITSREQARILREQANQAKIETERKRFDYEMYVKANTPSFSEEQAKIARLYLKRIQGNSSPPEIVSGKALNVMLDDLRKYAGRKATLEAIAVSEEVLAHLNVTIGQGNLGLLRNEGRFIWPLCLRELLDAQKKKDLEVQAQVLIQQAINGTADANLLKDLRAELDRIGTDLAKKINDIPTSHYLEAKRFIKDFDDARLALEKGDAKAYFAFQKFVRGGKTVQEVSDYMIAQGIRFAGAVDGDESAFHAFHSALAAFSIAVNAQFASLKD